MEEWILDFKTKRVEIPSFYFMKLEIQQININNISNTFVEKTFVLTCDFNISQAVIKNIISAISPSQDIDIKQVEIKKDYNRYEIKTSLDSSD